VYKTICVYATANRAKLRRSALRSENCKSEKLGILLLPVGLKGRFTFEIIQFTQYAAMLKIN